MIEQGDELPQLKVVKVHSTRQRWMYCGVALLLIAALLFSFYLGGRHYYGENRILQARQGQLQLELGELRAERADLKHQLVMTEQSSVLDRQSSEYLREQIVALESELASTQKNLAFYQNVMSPRRDGRGLSINTLSLRATKADPHAFMYRLVLTLHGNQRSGVKGYMRIAIGGEQEGKAVELPLRQLDTSLASDDIRFNFRYFQTVPLTGQFGKLVLPEGFEPRYVSVTAFEQGHRKPVERKFAWTIKG